MTDTIIKIPETTPDFTTEAANKLSELFPEVVADGKIDIEKLKTILGVDVDDARERFGLTWPGKTNAIRAAQTPTTATLMPDKENSIDWDTTQNVFIEGDNLEVLKILQKHYYGQIKMIYIDPPYNTGNDFVYSDNYSDSIGSYLELTGQTDEGGKLSTNSESAGRFHSNWLNMIYPRLKLARNLLCDDGVVFISIDDREVASLLEVSDEIYGEVNRLGVIVWNHSKQTKNDERYLASNHNYVVMYARSRRSRSELRIPRTKEDNKNYSNPDDDPLGPWRSGDVRSPSPRPTLMFEIETPSGRVISPPDNGWRWSKEELDKKIASGEVIFSPDESRIIRKIHLANQKGRIAESIWGGERYGTTRSATAAIKNLFNGKAVFDTPKPIELVKGLTSMFSEDADYGRMSVLDFFAGSGTTAHAVMQLNAEDGGNRRCISVQLPEPTGEKSEARKAEYDTISQISRERIRRAGKKILEEEASKLDGRADTLDVGFRAYKLVDTNFTKWKADSGLSEEELVGLFADLADSADDHARPEALLTEVLLKLGFSLTEKIEAVEVAGLSVFSVADGLVLAYMDEHTQPTLDQLRALVGEEPERLVVLEDAFQGNDELKTNLMQECRTHNVDLWTA